MNMKPRIVILSAFLTPMRSGAEACAEEVALRLADRYDITIVTARLNRFLPRKDMLRPPPGRGTPPGEGTIVIRVGFGCALDKWLYPFLAPFVVRRLQPQIIHAILESFAGLALVFCQWSVLSPARRLLTCQSTNTSFLLGTIHRAAHRVTVISRVLKDRAKKYGKPDAILIPNGIPLSVIHDVCLHTKKIPGRILFVGRLEPMKGVDTLLEAFGNLKTVTGNVHLRIVGDGSLKKSLLRQYAHLIESGRVIFVGFVPVPQVYQEFAQAQIFCGLSRSEALGNVFLEAQAAGCAVVATDTGGIPDIVEHGRTGILVPPDNPESAAVAIETLLHDHEQREALVNAGQENARQYDWGSIAQRYAEVYRDFLQT